MQQLSLLEPEPDPRQDLVHVWQSLQDEHRGRLTARLSRLIVAAAVHRAERTGGAGDERAQQDHR
jgi:hypothetical protein